MLECEHNPRLSFRNKAGYRSLVVHSRWIGVLGLLRSPSHTAPFCILVGTLLVKYDTASHLHQFCDR
ncbi:hypothetical protein EFJ98_05680 [Pseudomonas putida]|nr:hypothetical protein EFJ98_05680 [Pseudomonas putida]